ncbi:hypothetical protein [Rhabdothermincola salaria]|uniref:hypothetical protein n=1 Tax=Rhabdothermincola salaria TaxID=2903142 RepID=UPI001E57173B|nr:hypothetical protein [Rhabdothermincola salaria]MCD9622643.1 hypothetical protein [Rhabdothermincola salaria]
MQQVLVVLFWLWFAVALAVYGYRLWRRMTQGPKAERDARAAAAEGRAVGLGDKAAGRLGRRELPPLPDGPLEPRLPKSLAGVGPPEGEREAASNPGDATATETAGPTPDGGAAGAGVPTGRPTVAAALRGIDLPGDLIPLVDGDDPEVAAGHKVTFTTRDATLRTVVAGLADELERLGYEVDQTVVGDGAEHRLGAVRDHTAVTLVVQVDDSSAVTVVATT